MQPPLFVSSPNGPSLHGYVPVLQDQWGELQALRAMAVTRPEVLDALTPAMHIVGPPRRHLTRDALKGHVQRIQSAVGSRAIYLDFARADPRHAVQLRGKPLTLAEASYHYARHYRLAAIPVIPTGTSSTLIEAAGEAAVTDGRGLAIRHQLLGTTSPSGTSSAKAIVDLLAQCGLPAESVDVWLDLGFIDEDVEIRPQRITRLVERLTQLGDWRRIMLTGSSMPSALGCVPEGTDKLLPRREWSLWNALPANVRARLDFGDYAVQHPSPPSDGGASMRANIRYTVPNGHFIVRGRDAFYVEGVAQYVALCARIVSSERFAGSDYSWGDDVIDRCAQHQMAPGTQRLWRAAGTAHHLRVVTEQLRD